MPRGGAGGQCGERGHEGARARPPRRRGHEPVRQQLVSVGSYYPVLMVYHIGYIATWCSSKSDLVHHY